MTELETLLLNKLNALCSLHERQSEASSRLVLQLSDRLTTSAGQVASLSEQVSLLAERVSQLSAQVAQFSEQPAQGRVPDSKR